MTHKAYTTGKTYTYDEILDFFSALLTIYDLQDPIGALKNKLKMKKLFEGVILASTLLESLSLTKLKIYFKDRIKANRIEHLSLEQAIMFLLACEMIDQQIYSKMMKIREERNKLVHRVQPQYRLDYKKAEKLILNAIECLQALGYKKKI